jgi:hypothetical protein
LSGYKRWDNPYLQAEYGTSHYLIELDNQRLELDFEHGVRLMTN